MYIKTCHYMVAYSAPVHMANRQTPSLHPKNLSSSVLLVRVESKLLSNKVGRRAQGRRGGLWVLRREEKVVLMFSKPDARKQVV